MSNTAKTIDDNPLDVEGLDDIFDGEQALEADNLTTEDDNEPTSSDNIEIVDDSQTTSAEITEWLTTSQAAARLGKSERTVQRHAKKGKLESKTDDTGKLLIGFKTPADNCTTSNDNAATEDDKDLSDGGDAPTGGDRNRVVADTIFEKVIDDYREQISQLQEKLERSTYQLGRLQSELEHRDKEIKLLTDKELELTKWQKFKKWFIGG